MAVHDAYARFTPYELLLPDPEFPDRSFTAITREAEERGVDAGNPAAYVMLGAVQGALAELRDEDAGAESAHDHAGILFHAYHFWRCDGGVVLAQRKTVRGLLAGGAGAGRGEDELAVEDEAGWAGGLQGRAGYVQLPQHLVWMESPDEPPESVDGFFWHGGEDGVLHLAMVAGMRRDRPGCVVVTVPPQPLTALPGWATGPAREGGGDFTTSLPGAELDGLLGIRTPAEVFKLASLLLGRVVRKRLEPVAPSAPPAISSQSPPNDADPRATTLPFAVL
ncbi:MAG: hypothetical protein OXU69_14915 [Gemmatimonadota bacterium]|nr:hypothetical protein [Gemmatimonadota bacterium]MDE2985991.1 hypothetical protein [Gemmatimonadota bacterium]